MTLIGWWLLPLVITVLAYGWALTHILSLRQLLADPLGPFLVIVVGVFCVSIATIITFAAWALWAVA
ncbi:hypothetical protein [Ancylobacter rudongensis]|uniref:Uncharacterized protein n=1 Tax=Ancylobacter rudongensis TaxID=177413 RepID=A0A1G4UPH2_9HYPH|nr:hypothetical protein [Ancylobacter rudongensis]SCW95538.1 hypothetical protein SAMN05660859_0050 [Ancylobacter rudongensis]